LLFGFGTINSMFYEGDILAMYAVLGLALIPVCRLSDRTVFLIALALTMLVSVTAANATTHKKHKHQTAAPTDQQKQTKSSKPAKASKDSGKPAAE